MKRQYLDLDRELNKQWNRKIMVTPNVIGVLGTILKGFVRRLEELDIVLYFGLWPGQKCYSKVLHRREVTHSNGSYERKSRGRKLADEMGRGKKFSWYTHRLMHRKRVTCELHDSYFPLMTIKHAISKIEWAIE